MGLILDGNRRWARARGRSASDGHRAGFSRIPEVLRWCESLGVEVVTLWMLSTDNLSRDPAEVDALVSIIADTVDGLTAHGGWRIRHLGVRSAVRQPLLDALDRAVADTRGVAGLQVNLAVCYGGREEIIDACRSLLEQYRAEGLSTSEAAEKLSVETISDIISAGAPEPDLIIRTSGEQRTSGFMLWSGMYTDYWFTPIYWPDFDQAALDEALAHYRRSLSGRLPARVG
ncbi:di-trans,poly-cis-decaprenylcistransferase [Streptomyces sp. CB01881]|nr:di-trans,poly-cis-decaprenylcistransferase [Streptomyces sp. CB01881]TYC70833.1 di-trans,poly-cis-decaprenylcistransferase [Streptomyces sp. CB01881]